MQTAVLTEHADSAAHVDEDRMNKSIDPPEAAEEPSAADENKERIKRAVNISRPSLLKRGESLNDLNTVREFQDIAVRFSTPSALLCGAAAEGNISQLEELLSIPGFDVNTPDYDGRSALHLAVEEGRKECVEFLLSKGANVNLEDRWKSTPLRGAVVHGHNEIAQLLRQHGGRMMVSGLKKSTAFNAVLREEQKEFVKSIFKQLANKDEKEGTELAISTEVLERYLQGKCGLKPKRIAQLKEHLQQVNDNGTISWSRYNSFQRTLAAPGILQRALSGNLVIPDWREFTQKIQSMFREVAADCRGLGTLGPGTARSGVNDIGLCIATVDGQYFSIGEAEKGFPLSACGLPFMYSLCLEELGAKKISEFVGREPSGESSNSFQLNENHQPHNPLNHAGGIVMSALYHPDLRTAHRFKELSNGVRALSGGASIGFSQGAYLAQKDSSYQFMALGNFMKAEHSLPEGTNIPNTVDFYMQVNSLEVNCQRMATAAATYANNGVCPATNARVLQTQTVKSVLQVMYSCGMYDYSGEWACTIGIPAKSGSNGCIFLVIPSLLGLCIWAPPLDSNGNSYAGTEFCRRFAKEFKWSLLDVLYNSKEKN